MRLRRSVRCSKEGGGFVGGGSRKRCLFGLERFSAAQPNTNACHCSCLALLPPQRVFPPCLIHATRHCTAPVTSITIFCSLWRNLVYTRPEMIRRTPTLIALSDNDVQDVREEIQRHVAAMQSQGTPEPSALKNEEYKKAEEERKKKAAQTKEQRLGL